jgi:ABC-type glycerol-3-phosphate transport system substrate-binding protein
MTWEDNSFERFGLAGIALGRADNIARAPEVLLLMMLQNGIKLHDGGGSTAVFASQKVPEGRSNAKQVWEFFASFGNPEYRNYTWNENITRNNPAKEVYAFARGKVAMIAGYSYLYEDIERQIAKIKKRENGSTIKMADVGVVTIPQVGASEEKKTWASYFPYAVSANSEHQREAWEFLLYLTEEGNLREYHRQTKRPTPIKSLVEEQTVEAIYGVFARQAEWADSYRIWNEGRYFEVLRGAVTKINSGRATVADALREAEGKINQYLEEQRTVKQLND